MIDQAVMTEGPDARAPQGTGAATNHSLSSLEQRLDRLEDALAVLQDTRHLEQRIVERVAERVDRNNTEERDAGAMIIDAGRKLLPAAAGMLQNMPATGADAAGRTARALRGGAWFFFDCIAQARAMVRMFVDPRYHLGWSGRFVPLLLLLAIATSRIWIPGIGFLPDMVAIIVDKVADLVLAFFLFQVLNREARRYRETAPDLPESLRP